ncbi:hypothetical protein CAL26_21215 [Bordetella genomosp. 9]|uniref:Uncharacterized protein n=1 Tax=Bordetella genomosp. 9 TaxID=1416803 RepID=A0A261R5N3_9BORD|nr:hypothetical protein CAL26_21215 [Bordetella genomosp. 9]
MANVSDYAGDQFVDLAGGETEVLADRFELVTSKAEYMVRRMDVGWEGDEPIVFATRAEAVEHVRKDCTVDVEFELLEVRSVGCLVAREQRIVEIDE